MLNSRDLRYMGQQGDIIPKRAEIILSKLQPYFVNQSTNRCNRLMVRFRDKGGQLDTVRQSMNSDVIDIFTTCAIKSEVLRLLSKKLKFEIDFVEEPYCFYLIKWEPSSETSSTVFLNEDAHCLVLNVNTKYVCDTSVDAYTLLLPNDPINQDYAIIKDRFGTFNSNNIRVEGNGFDIEETSAVNLDLNYLVVKFVFTEPDNKWVMQQLRGDE